MSITVYFALYALSFFGYFTKANKSKNNKIIYLFVIFTLLITVSSVRASTVGTDMNWYYSKYYPAFKNTPWSNIQGVTYYYGEWEWGFCAFCKLLTYISPDVQFFATVSSLISILPFAIFIYKNSEDVVLSTATFIGFHIYVQTFNTIRQAMAVGILLLGVEFLKKKKYISFAIVLFIAMQFHNTAFMALALIVLDRIKFSKVKMYIVFLASFVLSFAYTFIVEKIITSFNFMSEYSEYSMSGSRDSGGYITVYTAGTFLILLFVFALAYMYINVKSKRTLPREITIEKYNSVKLRKGSIILSKKVCNPPAYWSEDSLVLFVYMALVFRFSAFILNVTARLAMYFLPFMLISLPHSINKISRSDEKRIVYAIYYVSLTVFFVYITTFSAGSLWQVVPYTTCFE